MISIKVTERLRFVISLSAIVSMSLKIHAEFDTYFVCSEFAFDLPAICQIISKVRGTISG